MSVHLTVYQYQEQCDTFSQIAWLLLYWQKEKQLNGGCCTSGGKSVGTG